jgi:hypothetical protein
MPFLVSAAIKYRGLFMAYTKRRQARKEEPVKAKSTHEPSFSEDTERGLGSFLILGPWFLMLIDFIMLMAIRTL